MPLKFWKANRRAEYVKDVPEIDSTPLLTFEDAESPTNIAVSTVHDPSKTIFGLTEKPIDTTNRFDKVFCSTWIRDSVVFGTKDQQVIQFNPKTNAMRPLHIPDRPGVSSSSAKVGVRIATTNDSETALIVGGRREEDLALIDPQSMQATALLVGHRDWVFGADWITDNQLLTGGRDKSIYVWSVNNEQEPTENKMRRLEGRIVMKTRATARALKLHPYRADTMFTVTEDGLLCSWDLNKGRRVSKTKISRARETVCMTVDGGQNRVFVGGKRNVYCHDPRIPGKNSVAAIPSMDAGLGVRSIEIDCGNISVGGGSGHLSVFDTRSNSYVESPRRKKYIAVSRGWIRDDEALASTLSSLSRDAVPSCVYTQAYHPTRQSVFVAGGPTMASLHGSLVSVFD